MEAVSKETHRLWEEKVWFYFFLCPENRRFNCAANKIALDEYLTRQGLELNGDNLAAAVIALGDKLAVLTPTQIAERKAERAREVRDAAQSASQAAKDA